MIEGRTGRQKCKTMQSSLGSSGRILVIGGTGMMGQHLVKVSLAAGHPTAVLVRPASSSAAADPSKLKLLGAIKASGATVIGVRRCLFIYTCSRHAFNL